MTKSTRDGAALYRRTHPSSVPAAEREMPTAETPMGRGKLLALSINAGVDPERRRLATKALEDWRAQQDDDDTGGAA